MELVAIIAFWTEPLSIQLNEGRVTFGTARFYIIVHINLLDAEV